MSEYALIMLNMVEYPCIHLNKQSFEYARILNVPEYCSIYLSYALVYLSMP